MGYLANIGNAILGRGMTLPLERSGSLEDPNTPISDWDGLIDGNIESASGERVTPKRALSIPALFQGVAMISGDVAKLPLGVWQRLPEGGREAFHDHHAFPFVNLTGMANADVNAFKFWRRLMVGALLWNNGYAWIDKNVRGEVLGLYNLLPDRTTPVRKQGKLYFMTEVAGVLVQLDADEVFHIEGPSLDGFCGLSLLDTFRDLFGAALAKQKFKSKFFKNGMTAGGVLAVPPGAKPATVQKLQAGIKAKYSNTDNAFKTLVLRDGYKWFSTQVDPQKGQLTEASEHDARQISRILNVRASRLSVEGSTSYNSDEMAMRDYHDGTLSHWLIGVRCEANAKLRTKAEREQNRVFFDYNINALMWADAKTRNEIATTGIQHGRWSPDETRAWENMNPYEGGNVFYRPLNLEPVGEDNTDDDPPPDTEPDGDDSRSIAARQLAEATLERAGNRLQIKAERKGAIPQAEQHAVREMIAPACEILGRDVDAQLTDLLNAIP